MSEESEAFPKTVELIGILNQAIHCCEVVEAIILEAMGIDLPEPKFGSKLEVAYYTLDHVIELLERVKRKL